MNEPTNHNTDPSQIEEKLRDALHGASVLRDVRIPETVDHAILSLIDTKVQEIESSRSKALSYRYLLYPLAAAALLVLALTAGLKWPGAGVDQAEVANPLVRREEMHDKPTDIVEVYLMAKRIESGEALSPDQDYNGDGRVDFDDISEITSQIVAISPQGADGA